MINHGQFEQYTPTFPPSHPFYGRRIKFACRISDQIDWYEFQNTVPSGRIFALVRDNIIRSVTPDISAMFPVGYDVYEFDEIDNPQVGNEIRNGAIYAGTSKDDIHRERDRRAVSGFEFNGKRYQSFPTDRENIAGASQLAFMAIVAGSPAGNLKWRGADTEDFHWIAEDNSLTPMDAQTVVNFATAAARHKAKMIFASRALKDMDPIPSNYEDDIFWDS